MTPVYSAFPRFPENWASFLGSLLPQAQLSALEAFLERESSSGVETYPQNHRIFAALESVAPENVRVVILGQDPYHGAGQATGLAFAVPDSLAPKPPSLRNILKEIESDLGLRLPPGASDLTGWAAQGVLLLNTVLTVRADSPLSHRDRGWEVLTDAIIRRLAEPLGAAKDTRTPERPLVFVLWGTPARKKRALLAEARAHLVLEAAHPSPLSAYRGFFGCRHFSRINAFLRERGATPIDWARLSSAADPKR
jgi:uracil-DNA glycosylase